MKAIAAVAIAQSYNVENMMASGLTVSIAVGILTVTGLLGGNEETDQRGQKGWGLMRWVPVPVVKGIQMGAGLSLCLSAGEKMLIPLGWKGPWWGDNLSWALLAALIVLAAEVSAIRTGTPRIPAALLIFLIGLLFAFIRLGTHGSDSGYTPHKPGSTDEGYQRLPSWPSTEAFIATLPTALGQLPLTTLNSILAVTHLASDLYPNGFPPPPSPGGLGFSISLMNILGCSFGAMPACHGSGGLAGQYKFGARSGSSVVLLGTVKLVLGIVAFSVKKGEGNMVRVLETFPKSFLGVMVIAAGVELSKVGGTVNEGARDLLEELNDDEAAGETDAIVLNGRLKKARELGDKERKERVSVMIVTVATLLAFRNDGIGFIVGMCWHWALRLPNAYGKWRGKRRTALDRDEESTGLLSRQ